MPDLPPVPGITAGTRLWKRAARVRANGIKVAENLNKDGHRISFTVDRHNRIEPNECEITVYGLSKTERDAISTKFDAARKLVLRGGGNGSVGDIELEAGSDGVVEQICKMDIREIRHEWMSPGWATTFVGVDGLLPFANAFVNETIAPGVDVNLVMTILATSMKIAFLDADSEQAFREALPQFLASQVQGGLVLQGPTRDVLMDLLNSMKVAWSFQGGKLQLVRFDKTTTDVAVLLSPLTGLKLEGLQWRSLGRVTAASVLNPKLTPGRQVVITDKLGVRQGAGRFRVDRAHTVGDTDTGPWDTTIDGRPTSA